MICKRRMTLEELRVVLDWAADEGWNPGLDDAEAFRAADPKGFFVAMDGDAPVAAISVVNHSDDFAFLGLYLCRPDHRGRGIGHALWRHAIAHAGDRTIGLDWAPADRFGMTFAGPRGLSIGTDRHRITGSTLTVTDRGFGNVLNGLEFNRSATAFTDRQSVEIALDGAAEPVRRFRRCARIAPATS